MKALLVAAVFSLASTSAGFTASITVADNTPGLPGVAQLTTEILIDHGLPLIGPPASKTVTVVNLHCDQHSNAALPLSNPPAMLASAKCRRNAPNIKDTFSGPVFGEARTILDILGRIQSANSANPVFTSCAAGGYCGTYATQIKCTIKTANAPGTGRWSCVYTN